MTKPTDQEIRRQDLVARGNGVIAIFEEIREVARLANQAGLAGFEVVDVDLDWTKGRWLITYRRRDGVV